MLMPRFSMRNLLLTVAGCSVFFLVLSFAIRGRPWALAVSIGVGSLLVTLVCGAVFFQGAYILSRLMGKATPAKAAGSPFAQDTAPPQYVRPKEPEK